MRKIRPKEELEIEKKQRERLAVRFAGRRVSQLSADSDIMPANEHYERRQMKIEAYKCEERGCGEVFESEKIYLKHHNTHTIIKKFNKKFPTEKDPDLKFANGDWSIQRDVNWLVDYKKEIASIVGDSISYEPFSYAWFRTLDDGDSPYYAIACRALNVCPQCYQEWGQPYFANNCKHSNV
jgi:hypothetical protein